MYRRKRREALAARIKAASLLLIANAVLWLGFAAFTVLEMLRFGNDLAAGLVGIFMGVNSASLLVSGILVGRRRRWGYHLALGVLFVNLLLTFTDQLGVVDYATLLLDLIVLWILIPVRKAYLNPS